MPGAGREQASPPLPPPHQLPSSTSQLHQLLGWVRIRSMEPSIEAWGQVSALTRSRTSGFGIVGIFRLRMALVEAILSGDRCHSRSGAWSFVSAPDLARGDYAFLRSMPEWATTGRSRGQASPCCPHERYVMTALRGCELSRSVRGMVAHGFGCEWFGQPAAAWSASEVVC